MYVFINLPTFIVSSAFWSLNQIKQKSIFKVCNLMTSGIHIYLWKLVLKSLACVWVWALNGYCCEKQNRGQAPNTSALVHCREEEHRVCHLGSLLFVNIFSVCSQPNFSLSCSPVRILWLHYLVIKRFSICQCLHQIPASPWSPF